MRYQEVENVVFTNKDGNSFTIKDMREYPEYTTLLPLEIDENVMVDEIASRPEIYGLGAEDQSFKIFEHNKVKIFEARFMLSKLSKVDIPNP